MNSLKGQKHTQIDNPPRIRAISMGVGCQVIVDCIRCKVDTEFIYKSRGLICRHSNCHVHTGGDDLNLKHLQLLQGSLLDFDITSHGISTRQERRIRHCKSGRESWTGSREETGAESWQISGAISRGCRAKEVNRLRHTTGIASSFHVHNLLLFIK